MNVEQLAERIRRLRFDELAQLRRLLEDMPGWGTTGVREPRNPRPPVDARGVALDAELGKTDKP